MAVDIVARVHAAVAEQAPLPFRMTLEDETGRVTAHVFAREAAALDRWRASDAVSSRATVTRASGDVERWARVQGRGRWRRER